MYMYTCKYNYNDLPLPALCVSVARLAIKPTSSSGGTFQGGCCPARDSPLATFRQGYTPRGGGGAARGTHGGK